MDNQQSSRSILRAYLFMQTLFVVGFFLFGWVFWDIEFINCPRHIVYIVMTAITLLLFLHHALPNGPLFLKCVTLSLPVAVLIGLSLALCLEFYQTKNVISCCVCFIVVTFAACGLRIRLDKVFERNQKEVRNGE